MFSLLSAIWEWIFRKEERKLILIGLDNAGKSTTLETLKHHYTGKGMDLERIPPTIGLNIGRFQVDGVVAICWDVGGQLNLRQLWSNYFNEVDGVVFVVDSCDHSRLEEAREALTTALSHESLSGKPLLVLANKSDLEAALSPHDISQSLKLDEVKSRPIKLTSCSSKLNLNVEEGLRWVVTEAVKFRQLKNSVSYNKIRYLIQSPVSQLILPMVVEVYLRNQQSSDVQLPDTILELENLLGEMRPSYDKLKESTDLLTEECRSATDESEAMEFYTYVQENLIILEAKADLISRIEAKINQLRGIFPSTVTGTEQTPHEEDVEDSGHYIYFDIS